jgi:DNA-binding NarL/FixJ family response regulator
VINWKKDDHRRDPGRHPEPEQPTEREIKALQAVQDGVSLTVGGARMGLSAPAIGSILSHAYERLRVKDLHKHHLSQDRRHLAIKVCRNHGWWPGDHDGQWPEDPEGAWSE